MSEKKLISDSKRARILAHDLLQKPISGTFFKQKKKNGNYDISIIRNNIDIDNFKFLINTFDKIPVEFSLLGDKKPKAKELFKESLSYKDFDYEFFWAKNILVKNIDKINVYLQLKEDYSTFLLFGNYEDAQKILDKIEKNFGQSVWLIKNKISFYQLSKGLEEHKNYSNTFKKQFQNGSLVKFLIHWLSVRNENNVTIARFKNQIEPILSKLSDKKQEGYREFLTYHLLEDEDLELDELIHVLRLSYSFCIIDYYESFLSLLKKMSSDKLDINRAKVKNFLLVNANLILDVRLTNLAFLYDISTDIVLFSHESVEIYDSLISSRASENIVEQLQAKRLTTINIILYSYEKFLLKNHRQLFVGENLLAKILYSLDQILEKGILGSTNEYLELQKLTVNFADLPWTTAIKLILSKEISFLENTINGFDLDIINLEIIHPLALEFIKNDSLWKVYEKKCIELYGYSTSVSAHILLRNNLTVKNNNISKIYTCYLNALINYNDEKYLEAIKYSQDLKTYDIPFFNRKANSIIAFSYLKMNSYSNLCLLITEVYLSDRNQHPFLPLDEVSKILIPKTLAWDECKCLIDLSIVLDICFRHSGKNQKTKKSLLTYKRYAYEDYLTYKKVDRPSELIFDEGDNAKLIYYLRYICQESIMELSGNFDGGSGEVLEERLKICRLLFENDITYNHIHKNEISEIVRRQVITSRRKEVDQSRVYVDIKSIKEWAEVELAESYARYVSYMNLGFTKSSVTKHLDTTSAIYTPEDEAKDLFIFIIEEVKSAYLSYDIGLDRFISTRIRHGELERTMRIPIQKHHLITKKEQKNGPYLRNEYWLSKIEVDSKTLSAIDSLFKKFSEDFDSVIAEIANEWLQMQTSDKPHGLFNFDLLVSDVERLQNLVEPKTTLKEFIEQVIKMLDNKLIMVLINIQSELNLKGKESAKNLLMTLNDEISNDCDLSNIELQRAINQARIDLALQFDKIIHWFNPSTEGNSAPYTIEDAVLVSEAIIKEGDSNFAIELHQNDPDNYEIHGQLPSLIDIFINIFDNVVKRSGLANPITIVKISKENIDGEYYWIVMNFSNALGEDVDLASTVDTLNRIKEKVDHNDYLKDVAKDENSGLIKIFKTIKDFSIYEANIQAKMDFGIINNRFEINISIPFKLHSLELEISPEIAV